LLYFALNTQSKKYSNTETPESLNEESNLIFSQFSDIRVGYFTFLTSDRYSKDAGRTKVWNTSPFKRGGFEFPFLNLI